MIWMRMTDVVDDDDAVVVVVEFATAMAMKIVQGTIRLSLTYQ
jgi:hypothetical protein